MSGKDENRTKSKIEREREENALKMERMNSIKKRDALWKKSKRKHKKFKTQHQSKIEKPKEKIVKNLITLPKSADVDAKQKKINKSIPKKTYRADVDAKNYTYLKTRFPKLKKPDNDAHAKLVSEKKEKKIIKKRQTIFFFFFSFYLIVFFFLVLQKKRLKGSVKVEENWVGNCLNLFSLKKT